MTRTIWHIRHGETDWNAAGRLQGMQDIPLNAVGRAQADANGRILAAHFTENRIDPAALHWVASPLGRTRETMRRVRTAFGLAPEDHAIAPSLRELTFGDWEGKTYDEVARDDPAGWEAYRLDKWHFAPPGGENYVMLSARIGDWLAGTSGDMVIVSHGGVFRALRHLLEVDPEPDLAHLSVPQDRIFRWRDADGAWL